MDHVPNLNAMAHHSPSDRLSSLKVPSSNRIKYQNYERKEFKGNNYQTFNSNSPLPKTHNLSLLKSSPKKTVNFSALQESPLETPLKVYKSDEENNKFNRREAERKIEELTEDARLTAKRLETLVKRSKERERLNDVDED